MMFGTEAILILITGMSVQSLVYIKQSLVTGWANSRRLGDKRQKYGRLFSELPHRAAASFSH